MRLNILVTVFCFGNMLYAQYNPWETNEEYQNFVKIVDKENYRTRTDLVYDYVMVEAEGTADPAKATSMAHARTLALKTARALAYEKLLETVEGIKLTSHSVYKDELLKWSFMYTRVKGMIQNAQVMEEKVTELDDGSVLAKVQLVYRMHGKDGILTPFVKEYIKSPEVIENKTSYAKVNPLNNSQPVEFTGVMLKIKNLKWDPARFWKIQTPSGQTIWDTRFVDSEYADTEITYGTWSLWRNDKKKAEKFGRIGDKPLEIKVQQITETGNLVISEKDALQLRQTNNSFLYENRLAVIYSK